MFIATLVATTDVSDEDLTTIADVLDAAAIQTSGFRWVEPSIAGEFGVPGHPHEWLRIRGAFDEAIKTAGIAADVIVQPEAHRARKLLIADMDSTMITVECIDELADYVGLKSEVAAVTEAAMRGELDFAEALRSRVALLAGLSEAKIAECLDERVKLMGGAKALIGTFRANGGRTVLVSGGFTHFTGPVAAQLGFDRAVANRLVVKGGALTGEVEQPIVDAQTKRDTLFEESTELGISLSETVAIGDGANDIPMIAAAGLGIAYRAKPKTETAADAAIRHGDLSALLYAMGYAKHDWVKD